MPSKLTTTFAAALLAGLLTGCEHGDQAGGQAGESPSHYTTAATARVSVSHPDHWRDRGAVGEAALVVESAADGRLTGRLAVLERIGKASDAGLAAAAAESGRERGVAWRKLSSGPLDVAGAKDARRVRYAYRASGVAMRGLDIVAVADDRTILVVRLTWRRGALDKDVVRRIATSVAVKS